MCQYLSILFVLTCIGAEIYERLKHSRQNMKERKMKNIRKFIKMDVREVHG